MSGSRRVKLRRMLFATDVDPDDEQYLGTVSEPFMVGGGREIVDVDWSVPGEVQVTFLETDG